MQKFKTLMGDGASCPPPLNRHQFEEVFKRKPRMTGALDYFEAMAMQRQGYEVVEVSCLGDDLESYIVISQRPVSS